MPHKESREGFLSVTEVLSLAINKPFLAFWRGKIGNELAGQIQRESQELGIAVHEQIEQRFKSDVQSLCSENAERMTQNFWNKFVIPWEVKPVLLEVSLEDEKLKLQGTFDAIIDSNKGVYVADWKTSNQLDKISVPLQLAAYAHLSGKNVWKGVAVRIDKEKDKVEIKEYEDLAPYWPIFLNCMLVARFCKFGLENMEDK